MTSIDRLFLYLRHLEVSPYNFEKTCGIANGYLKKQSKGKGTIGSEILEKIASNYIDLSLTWLITGSGKMLLPQYPSGPVLSQNLTEPEALYLTEQTIKSLQEKILILQNTIADKEKIISLLEEKQTFSPSTE